MRAFFSSSVASSYFRFFCCWAAAAPGELASALGRGVVAGSVVTPLVRLRSSSAFFPAGAVRATPFGEDVGVEAEAGLGAGGGGDEGFLTSAMIDDDV